MTTQATAERPAKTKLPPMRVMSAKHVEVLEQLLASYRKLKECEAALAQHDEHRARYRDVLQFQADTAYALWLDAITAAEAAGAVLS